jgi:hypothetical protein
MPPDDEEDSYTLIGTDTKSMLSAPQYAAVNDVSEKIKKGVPPDQVVHFVHENFNLKNYLDLDILAYLLTTINHISPENKKEYQEPLRKEVDNVILRFYMEQIKEIQRLIEQHAPASQIASRFASLFHKDIPLPLNTVQYIIAVCSRFPQEYQKEIQTSKNQMIFQFFEHHVQTIFKQIKTKDSPEQVANAFVSLLGSKIPLSLPIIQYLISAIEQFPTPYRLTLMEKLMTTEQCHMLWNITFFKDSFRRILYSTLQQTSS